MAQRNILEVHEARYRDDSDIVAELITEPVTLPDGSQCALFHHTNKSNGLQEVLSFWLGDGYEVMHYACDAIIVDLGDGDFNRGVIEFARRSMPDLSGRVTFIDIDGGESYSYDAHDINVW